MDAFEIGRVYTGKNGRRRRLLRARPDGTVEWEKADAAPGVTKGRMTRAYWRDWIGERAEYGQDD